METSTGWANGEEEGWGEQCFCEPLKVWTSFTVVGQSRSRTFRALVYPTGTAISATS